MPNFVVCSAWIDSGWVVVVQWLPACLSNVSSLSTWWIDVAECWAMVRQRRMSHFSDWKEKYVQGLSQTS